MNKWQIIGPLVTIALFAGLVYVGASVNLKRDSRRVMLTKIGQELLETNRPPRWIRPGPDLEMRLQTFLRSPGGVAEIKSGDEPPPIGNGQAFGRVFLTNAGGERLGIRVRREADDRVWRVLGFWANADPSD